MFEWITDPTIWIGLLTLVTLEIVLGIDNLIFIAILADKLPPTQRDRARIVGLSFALVMRLALLAGISWAVSLTEPLLTVWGLALSGRDLILLAGGVFLLFKATTELHERLEGGSHMQTGPRMYAGFGAVIAQIVVLDAVFSLDSVITAVGMVDHLAVMMIAVVIAVVIMMVATRGAGQETYSWKTVLQARLIDDPDRRSLPDEPADAAFATKNYLKPKFVIPLHYATNPQHKGTPAEHIKALGQTSTKVIKINPGDSLEF